MFALASIFFCASSAAAQSANGQIITGVVVSGSNQAPLGHSMITIQPLGRQTFSDDMGRFAFIVLSAGTYQIRVMRLGFTPTELTVTVASDSNPARIRIALERLQVSLAAIRVTADAPCVAPGAPDSANESGFVAIFEQVEQNAQEYRLLADSFPYLYREKRTQYTLRGGAAQRPHSDTLSLRSDSPDWTYTAGSVVSLNIFTRELLMHLPILSDFASDEFIKNHCFRYSGEESTPEGNMVRIDFRAADRLATPDVNGTILLDPTTFQIRSTVLSLSRMPSWFAKDVADVNVTTYFREVEPSVLVLSNIHAVTGTIAPKNARNSIEAI